ncbi:hypothetical protein ACHWQZ_G011226 [Mnemiopsis leidyi]
MKTDVGAKTSDQSFLLSDASCTESSEDGCGPRNVKPSEDVTRLIIEGLKHNGATLPDSFAPFVDKSKIGSLPMKPLHQPVVGYRSGVMAPTTKKVTKVAGNRRKKCPKKRRQVIRPPPPAESSDSEGIVIGSESEKSPAQISDDTSTSGKFLSSNNSAKSNASLKDTNPRTSDHIPGQKTKL